MTNPFKKFVTLAGLICLGSLFFFFFSMPPGGLDDSNHKILICTLLFWGGLLFLSIRLAMSLPHSDSQEKQEAVLSESWTDEKTVSRFAFICMALGVGGMVCQFLLFLMTISLSHFVGQIFVFRLLGLIQTVASILGLLGSISAFFAIYLRIRASGLAATATSTRALKLFVTATIIFVLTFPRLYSLILVFGSH